MSRIPFLLITVSLLAIAHSPFAGALPPTAPAAGAASCIETAGERHGASPEAARELAEIVSKALELLGKPTLTDRVCAAHDDPDPASRADAETSANSLTRSYDWIHQSELRIAQQLGEPHIACTAACFAAADPVLELARRAFTLGLEQVEHGGFSLALYNTLWRGCLDVLSHCLEAC